jgi:uncharacterized protein (TIGR03067 family)
MGRRLLAGLGLVLAFGALVRADGGDSSAAYQFVADDNRAELERGEWRIVGMKFRGMEYPADVLENGDVRLIFKGHKLTMKQAGGPGSSCPFKLNPTGPNEIDWMLEPGRSRGVYELKNGTLKIAVGTKERPKNFSGEGDVMLYILKRVQP